MTCTTHLYEPCHCETVIPDRRTTEGAAAPLTKAEEDAIRNPPADFCAYGEARTKALLAELDRARAEIAELKSHLKIGDGEHDRAVAALWEERKRAAGLEQTIKILIAGMGVLCKHGPTPEQQVSFAVKAKMDAECRNGHQFTPENTITLSNGWRICRTCSEALRTGGAA